MSDDRAFLRAIREDPEDPARRLVYADWLEERGDPRGEYLRLACRERELRARIDPEWLKAVQEGPLRIDDVPLRSGRFVSLRELRQFGTYEGLLEGLPTREMNQARIERVLGEERNRASGAEPYLIPPVETPIKREEPYPFGEPAAIPAVTCIGRFRSYDPARDPAHDYSELVVVWFQREFAPPIDSGVWQQLLAIDWDRHANDYDY
jgi:uncharacterized protein (TIGR02996 family)